MVVFAWGQKGSCGHLGARGLVVVSLEARLLIRIDGGVCCWKRLAEKGR